MDSELPLEGLFLHLVRRGFPLTFRDYQDALRALAQGRGLLTRERLLWLLETRWTRTDEWYNYKSPLFATVGDADYSPRGTTGVHVLLRMDEATLKVGDDAVHGETAYAIGTEGE